VPVTRLLVEAALREDIHPLLEGSPLRGAVGELTRWYLGQHEPAPAGGDGLVGGAPVADDHGAAWRPTLAVQRQVLRHDRQPRRADATQAGQPQPWRRGCAEPWLLVTNLNDPTVVERLYRRRMQIEHGFRDWKHHLHLRLPASRLVHSARRFGRLLTGVVLAY
jgi:hypothetical protein